jgi:hypothetical protein
MLSSVKVREGARHISGINITKLKKNIQVANFEFTARNAIRVSSVNL